MKHHIIASKIFLASALAAAGFLVFSGSAFACSPNPSGSSGAIFCSSNPSYMDNEAGEQVNHTTTAVSGGWVITYSLTNGNYFIGNNSTQTVLGGYGYYTPQYTFTLSNNNPSFNTPVTVTWTTQGVSSCTVTGSNGNSWSGTSGSQTSSNLTSTTNFTLSCSGPAGGISKVQTATVSGPPLLTLSISQTLVNSGDNAVLSWTINNANTCSASSTLGNFNISGTSSGSANINNITSAQKFTLTCQNASGQSSTSTGVSIYTNLYVNPIQVTVGGSVFLNWISALGSACTVSGGGLNYAASSTGYLTKVSMAKNTTFNLACTDTSGSLATSSRRVSITPRFSCQ